MARSLRDPQNELWLSPISIWELCVLVDRGRITLRSEVAAWTAEALARAPLTEAPVTHEVALATARVELPHRDPADRFLAATAQVFELTLATADRRLIDAANVPTLANQ